MITIQRAFCEAYSEPLQSPFGFKGSALSNLWQVSVVLESHACFAQGLGVQSVLWSDAAVFNTFGEQRGNQLMLALTRYALELLQGTSYSHPSEVLPTILPAVMRYGRRITGNPSLRATFALNALVPVDHALWLLYAKENQLEDYQRMTCPSPALTEHHAKLANIPLISYHTPPEEVESLAKQGICLFKIKIGSDPDSDGDLEKMLDWDCRRLASIHQILKQFHSWDTVSGKILYYLDANGRYDSPARLERLLDHAASIGALDQIILLEEPFAEENSAEVGNLPVRVAADESIHSLNDLRRRISLGYRAVTLKPIAKTLSLTLELAEYAAKENLCCFCADLTVNPIMAEWNKNLAARLAPLPELKIGLVESNGAQNYTNWEAMLACHPCPGAGFIRPKDGAFLLDSSFYNTSGGIYLPFPFPFERSN